MSEIRTERTQGLKPRLNASQRTSLFALRHTPGYQTLLDLMEMACIEQETRLINADVDNADLILAEHRMAKAFWQVFTSMQAKVEAEVAFHLSQESERQAAIDAEENYDEDQELLRP